MGLLAITGFALPRLQIFPSRLRSLCYILGQILVDFLLEPYSAFILSYLFLLFFFPSSLPILQFIQHFLLTLYTIITADIVGVINIDHTIFLPKIIIFVVLLIILPIIIGSEEAICRNILCKFLSSIILIKLAILNENTCAHLVSTTVSTIQHIYFAFGTIYLLRVIPSLLERFTIQPPPNEPSDEHSNVELQ